MHYTVSSLCLMIHMINCTFWPGDAVTLVLTLAVTTNSPTVGGRWPTNNSRCNIYRSLSSRVYQPTLSCKYPIITSHTLGSRLLRYYGSNRKHAFISVIYYIIYYFILLCLFLISNATSVSDVCYFFVDYHRRHTA